MKSVSAEPAIAPDTIQKWQRIVDLLADIVHVPSAVVCKLEPPHYTHYKIMASSAGSENPFPIGDAFSMDIGTFCETVIKSREPLLVVNALEDDEWDAAPELKVGMVSYLGFPIVWPDGKMFGTICVLDDKANRYSDTYQELLVHCRDVLQADLQTLVRLDDELDDQRMYLSELFARVPEAVVMIDHTLNITRVNPEFTNTFGYTAEEALGREIEILLTPNDLQEEAKRQLDRMFETGEAVVIETVRRRKNGTCLPVSVICVPVQSNDGRKAGYLIHRDLTDVERFEEEQRRYLAIQLELANVNRIATLSQLSASIAHELNQPLTGIIANCGTCLRMLTSSPQELDGAQEAVRRTMRDADRASEVVRRLRALFSNKEPALDPVDLNDATREVIALSLGELQDARAILRTELADDLPLISADRIQLQQVILNLLRNALDSMRAVDERAKNILIRTEMGDGKVLLTVKDTGLGFAPETANRLFEAFYSTKDAGMGVGLAVSRSIIEGHHGRLWASLNDGPGATFTFAVPSRAEPAPNSSIT